MRASKITTPCMCRTLARSVTLRWTHMAQKRGPGSFTVASTLGRAAHGTPQLLAAAACSCVPTRLARPNAQEAAGVKACGTISI